VSCGSEPLLLRNCGLVTMLSIRVSNL
jgi:hypothetical protein